MLHCPPRQWLSSAPRDPQAELGDAPGSGLEMTSIAEWSGEAGNKEERPWYRDSFMAQEAPAMNTWDASPVNCPLP